MAMEPFSYVSFINTLTDLVASGKISQDRIDDAVRRILRVKFEMGLFEHPYSNRLLIDSVGTDYHRTVARQCVRESLVLLKKRDDLLPLAKENMNIHVAGNSADNLGNQCGGWTLTHQGITGNNIPGTTIYDGFMQVAPGNSYTYSGDASGGSSADIGIVVIGETPYAEGPGDRGSIDGIITVQHIQAVKTMKSYGIPVVVILVTGRPVTIRSIYHYADVIIVAWLPGTEGQGVADVLFGDYTPTGRLSHSWPVEDAQVPVNFGDANYFPFYPYDYGINSFENSTTGSEPQFYSAAVTATGGSIELSFNKKMVLQIDEEENFSVKVNGEEYLLQSMDYAPEDSFRVRLDIDPVIMNGEQVYLSYTPGSFHSADGGQVSEIVNYQVLNNSEIDVNPVQEISVENVIVYPNPASNCIYLQPNNFNTKQIHLTLYNIAGQNLKVPIKYFFKNQIIILTTIDLPSGLYYIRISDNSKTGTVKVQINNE